MNEEKHLREAQLDEGEFGPVAPTMTDAEYEDYYAKIRAEVGYDDDAFESDADSGSSSIAYCLVLPAPPTLFLPSLLLPPAKDHRRIM